MAAAAREDEITAGLSKGLWTRATSLCVACNRAVVTMVDDDRCYDQSDLCLLLSTGSLPEAV